MSKPGEIRHLPEFLAGRTTEEWLGQWVEAETTASAGRTGGKRVTGMVTRVSVKRYESGSACYLTIADPEGFIHGAIDAREAKVVSSPLKGVF